MREGAGPAARSAPGLQPLLSALPLGPLVRREGRPCRHSGSCPDGPRRGLEASLRPSPGPAPGGFCVASLGGGGRILPCALSNGRRPRSGPESVSAQVLPGRLSSPPEVPSCSTDVEPASLRFLRGRRGGTAGEAPPSARGPCHGPRRGPAARREAWLGGRPLAAPQPGRPGRHEDRRGGTSAARGAVACVAPGTEVRVFVGTGLSRKPCCSLTLLEKLGAGCCDNRKADARVVSVCENRVIEWGTCSRQLSTGPKHPGGEINSFGKVPIPVVDSE